MKAKEIRALPKEELKGKLSELKRELIKNNAQIATGTTPKSPGQIREMKKTIARILTITKEQSKAKKLPTKEAEKPKAKPSNESEKGLEKSKTSQKVKPKKEKTEE